MLLFSGNTACCLIAVIEIRRFVLTTTDISKVVKGQKIIIFSLLAVLISIGVGIGMSAAAIQGGGFLILVVPVSQIVGLYGVLLAARGLGSSLATLVLLAFLMLMPGIAIFLLLIIASRANKALRDSGYEVGFFGAKPSQ